MYVTKPSAKSLQTFLLPLFTLFRLNFKTVGIGERESKLFLRFVKNILILLVFGYLFLQIKSPVFAYPPYTANSDLVISGPYDTIYSGSDSAWGLSATGFRELITLGQKYRVRQNGTISKIKIYTINKTNLTGFYLKIWRKNGSTYNLIGSSENIVSDLIAGGSATITLTSPIVGVQEGDYYGYRIEKSGNTFNFTAKSTTGNKTYLVTNVEPTTTNYDWESQANYDYVLPIELYMQASQAIFIGDSIIAGHPANYSFLESTATTNIASTIEKQLSTITGYTYQNMGIGGQTTTQISARFTNDAINLKPKIIIAEGGVNDVYYSVAKSTFIANWTSILDVIQSSDVQTVLVLKILPWTGGSTSQMQTIDDWNTSLTTLVSGYSKAVLVDANSYVGQFRVGGDVGNLWDIKTAYNADNIHFNQAGHARIAQAIADALDSSVPTTTDNVDTSWHTGSVTITLSCNDGAGSGCANTYYTTDGTDPTTSSSQGTSFTLSSDGTYTIKYFSVDAVGNQEAVKTATNQVKIDATAPVTTATSVIIDADATYTNHASRTVSLAISATDATSGMYQMMISESAAFTGASWISYATSNTRNLSAPDGLKTLYIKFKDSAGNESISRSDSIITDITVPATTVSSIVIDSGAAYVTNSSGNVSLAIAAADTPAGLYQMMISESSLFTGASWVTYATSKTFSLSSGEGLKTIYIKFKDNAGNISATKSDSIDLDYGSPANFCMWVPEPLTSSPVASQSFSLNADGTLGSSFTSSIYLDPASNPNIKRGIGYVTVIGGKRNQLVLRPNSNGKDSDSYSGVSYYALRIDNPGEGGDFEIPYVPAEGTYPYQDSQNKYKVYYHGFTDPDKSNRSITIETLSSPNWGVTENNGEFRKSGEAGSNANDIIMVHITAYDNAGNSSSIEVSFKLDSDIPNPISYIKIGSKILNFQDPLFKQMQEMNYCTATDKNIPTISISPDTSLNLVGRLEENTNTVKTSITNTNKASYENPIIKYTFPDMNSYFELKDIPLTKGQSYLIEMTQYDQANNHSYPIYFVVKS